MQTQALHPSAAGTRPVAAVALADSDRPGVSWGAVVAGAAAAAALSFILLILGMGLGLAAVSPYQYNATPLGTAAVVWIAFTQLAASGVGGYLAGRLRLRWPSIHADEALFRDTAHGLLAWAVATLLTVATLAGGVRAVLSGAIDAAAPVAASVGAGTAAAAAGRGNTYFADMILRAPTGDGATDAQRTEVNRILLTDLPSGKISADDRTYLTQLVARRTGLSEADAGQRVDLIYAQAQQAANEAKAKAEQARQAAAKSALWMFFALLLGAFVAALCATVGGRQRDHERVLARTATATT